MKTSDLRAIILKMFRGKELYGYEAHKKLAAQGIDIEFGRLYRILKDMLKDGTLDSRWEKSKTGPNKRLYRISEGGRKELNQMLLNAIETISASYVEYLMNLPSKNNFLEKISELLTKELKDQCTIAYIAVNPSPWHEKTLSALQSRFSTLHTYIVSPKVVNLNLHLENLVSLEGGYDSVPLKNKCIDLLVVIDIPQNRTLRSATREWCRVMKEDGEIAIFAPSVVLHKLEEPLTLGDFIEICENRILRNGETVNYRLLLSLLQKHFQRVEEKHMAHTTLLLVSKPRFLQQLQ